MNQTVLAWAAFRAMMRAASRDPLWAFLALIVAPFRYGATVFKLSIVYVLVVLVVAFILQYVMQALGAARGDVLWMIGNLAIATFALVFLFRLVTNPLIVHFGDMVDDTHGSARFATTKEVAPLTRSDTGLLIGRDPKSKQLLRYDGPAHLLTMAPTRTGKGVGTIIPNLLMADRSIICIDPKGENAIITGGARRSFGPVYVLDPFNITSELSASFNPLDGLDPDAIDVAEDASTLADALVFDEPGMAGEAHWNEEAKALISGLILHVVTDGLSGNRSLITLREYLTLAPDAFAALLKDMQQSPAAGGLVARAANRHLGKSDREAAGVLSAAQRHAFPRQSAYGAGAGAIGFSIWRSQEPKSDRVSRAAAGSTIGLFALAETAGYPEPCRYVSNNSESRKTCSLPAR